MKPTCCSFERLALSALVACLVTFTIPASSFATVCIVPDSGGTAALPPATPSAGCTDGYVSPTDLHMIIDGLPPGTTVEIGLEHQEFICTGTETVCSFAVMPGDCDDPGGDLGGGRECRGSNVQLQMQGTGSLSTYTATKNMPLQFETHVAPRTPGSPVQSFDTEMFRMQGQITGDPDFDLLRITAGNDFGMPSPGHTTLTQDPGGWNVDSFFDITYRIDFVGHAGGPFGGMSGSTTGTIRMAIGQPAAAVYDHLECFKAKDSIKLTGMVDVPSLAGSPYSVAGCKIGSAKKYCRPAQKVVVSSTPPATPLPGPNLTSDYICYKVKCPKVDLSTSDTDQFGTHNLIKMKHAELCVPAP